MMRCYRVWFRYDDEPTTETRAWLVDAESVDDASDKAVEHFNGSEVNIAIYNVHIVSVECLDK